MKTEKNKILKLNNFVRRSFDMYLKCCNNDNEVIQHCKLINKIKYLMNKDYEDKS